MSDAKPHLRTLEEIEREGIPGLVEVLRKEGIDAVWYVLWDACHRLAPRLLSPGLAQLRDRGAEASRLGDGGSY